MHYRNKEQFKTISMSVTLISTPSATTYPPVPVSQALKWCFQNDDTDAVSTPGTQATVVVTFPSTCSIPANGTKVIIWGQTFTVNNATPFTGNTFEVVASGLTTASNFRKMLKANYFFQQYCNMTQDVPILDTTITWKECGEQQKFSGASNMDDTAITDTGGTMVVTNGVTPVYVPGFWFVARLLHVDATGSTYIPITKFEGYIPDKTCTGVDQLCLDYMPAVRGMMWAIMPELGIDTYVDNFGVGYKESLRKSGHMGHFIVEYGWAYQDANAQPLSGTFERTAEVSVINAYFPPEDVYGMRRYWDQHPSGFPPDQSNYRLFTNQPLRLRLRKDSFAWMYYIQQEAAASLRAEFTAVKLDGTAYSAYYFTMPNNGDFIQNFNISPGHLADHSPVDLDNTAYIQIRMTATSGTLVRSEFIYIVIDHTQCASSTDVYFQTQLGTIGTIPVKIEEMAAGQTGSEVDLAVRDDKAAPEWAGYGGRTLVNLRSYNTVKISARDSYNAEQRKWFEQFRHSPHKWIKVASEDGGYIARKLIINPGELRTFEAGGNIVLEATGYMQDLPIQSSSEPIELP